MNEYPIDEHPSQLRLITTLLGVVLLAAFSTPLLTLLRDALPAGNQSGWNANTDLLINGVFLAAAIFLCVCAFKSSGLGVADKRSWKRHGPALAFAWIMPPLLVLSVYPVLTLKPYHAFHWPMAWWLLGAAAQEFLFSGFIYGQLLAMFPAPAEGPGASFSAAALITAFLYMLYHWPNLRSTEHGMTLSFVQFKLLYAFLGCLWMLNVRRWSNGIWLGVLNHVLVNWLATVI